MYIEGHTIQEPNENGQTDTQRSIKHNTENLRLFNMNSIKKLMRMNSGAPEW